MRKTLFSNFVEGHSESLSVIVEHTVMDFFTFDIVGKPAGQYDDDNTISSERKVINKFGRKFYWLFLDNREMISQNDDNDKGVRTL